MKIAAIVICYNDDYKFEEWKENYAFYKDAIYQLIIVYNGSKESFLCKVRNAFPEAVIIERKVNGGLTAAYNDGIKLALSDEKVDSIMLIGNDMRLTNESVRKLHEALFQEEAVGMVTPIMLSKDSDIVEDAGSTVSYCFYMHPLGVGKKYSEIEKKNKYVDSVSGGMNLGKREFYEKVGLQDEKLFMYSDEVDIGTRAKKLGFKMMIIYDAVVWHQHINPSRQNRRLPYSYYLMARNKVYLGRKFYSIWHAWVIFLNLLCRNILSGVVSLIKRRGIQSEKYAIRGAVNGLCGNMELPDNMILYQEEEIDG